VLEENAGRWESASARDLARVEALARAVVARLLHEPTIRLRSLDPERVHGSIEMLRDLFGLRGDAATQVDEEGAGNQAAAARADAHDNVRELRSSKP
jgi:glutamyl-tRNA reductase